MSTISFKIEKLMEAKKLTKTDFAKLTGINRDTVYNLTDESIKVSTLLKISDVLKVPITHFFELPNSKKGNMTLELTENDLVKIDLKNNRLEIVKQ